MQKKKKEFSLYILEAIILAPINKHQVKNTGHFFQLDVYATCCGVFKKFISS